MQVCTIPDSIVLILKSKLIKGSTTSDIAQPAKLLPFSPGLTLGSLSQRDFVQG